MKKYIIAAIEGVRFDIAPEYTGIHGKVYNYGSFSLLCWNGSDYGKEYEEAYEEIAEYVKKVNAELKNNSYFRAWCYAEMLTPKEQGQYNDVHCRLFHTWLVDKILNSDKVIASQTRVCGKDLRDRIDTYEDQKTTRDIMKYVSGEMLANIHLPGEYLHGCYTRNSDLFLKNYPIFEFGWTLTMSIQLIDKEYSSCFKEEE